MRNTRPKPYNWDEFLVLANDLLATGGEAEFRSAISRAYYAAFNHAEHAIKLGVTRYPKDEHAKIGSHEKVWECMDDQFGSDGVMLSDVGLDLRDLRVIADYYHNWLVEKKDAEGAIERADALIADIKKLKASA